MTVIVEDLDGRWLLRKVTSGPILRGLWLPPFAEIDSTRLLEKQARDLAPYDVESSVEIFEPIKHSITHRRIEVTPVRARPGHPVSVPGGWKWADPASPKLPTSSLLGKLLRSVHDSPRHSIPPVAGWTRGTE